jgi:Lon protease-like protein
VPLTDRYKAPADLPARIPVFPLRGAILLPRATLPLNVFEPRYLAMIDDALTGQRIVGIVQPATGSQRSESPSGKSAALKQTGCAGRITSYQELDDGRLIITLTGVCRFETLSEAATPAPYRFLNVGYARFAHDFTPGLGEERVERAELLRVLRAYLDQNNINMDWAAIERTSSEFLVNTLSIMSPYAAEEKQALLEADDTATRAEILVALAKMELAGHGGSGGTLQ